MPRAEEIAPQVTWGTNPGMVTSVTERIPDPHDFKDPKDQKATESALLMFKFEIAPSRKEVLLKGLDDIGTSMQHSVAIDAYEKSHTATATMSIRST